MTNVGGLLSDSLSESRLKTKFFLENIFFKNKSVSESRKHLENAPFPSLNLYTNLDKIWKLEIFSHFWSLNYLLEILCNFKGEDYRFWR